MKVDLTKVITTKNKEALLSGDKPLTVKEALLIALLQPEADKNGNTVEEAIKMRRLFDKIDEAEGEVDLLTDQIVKLKEIAAKKLSAIVAGAVILAIEPGGE